MVVIMIGGGGGSDDDDGDNDEEEEAEEDEEDWGRQLCNDEDDVKRRLYSFSALSGRVWDK